MKIALVTGPSSGIGRATAMAMAANGYHVVAAGRSMDRTRPLLELIDSGGGSAEFLQVDLARLDSVREAAQSFTEQGRALDVLVNNAGIGGTRGRTPDGFEIHFGVNHLGHFLLTLGLESGFRSGTRIVVVSSEAHRRVTGIDWERVKQKSRSFLGFNEYSVSKLANILFARSLAQRHPEWRTYSVHPGVVSTGIFPWWVGIFLRNALTPEQGAETSVWCATASEVSDQSGLYYSRRQVRDPSPTARDDTLAEELWQRSEQWCGLAPDH